MSGGVKKYSAGELLKIPAWSWYLAVSLLGIASVISELYIFCSKTPLGIIENWKLLGDLALYYGPSFFRTNTFSVSPFFLLLLLAMHSVLHRFLHSLQIPHLFDIYLFSLKPRWREWTLTFLSIGGGALIVFHRFSPSTLTELGMYYGNLFIIWGITLYAFLALEDFAIRTMRKPEGYRALNVGKLKGIGTVFNKKSVFVLGLGAFIIISLLSLGNPAFVFYSLVFLAIFWLITYVSMTETLNIFAPMKKK